MSKLITLAACIKTRCAVMRGDERGATAIEYALIAGSISVVIAAAVNAIGVSVAQPFIDLAAWFTAQGV